MIIPAFDKMYPRLGFMLLPESFLVTWACKNKINAWVTVSHKTWSKLLEVWSAILDDRIWCFENIDSQIAKDNA